MALWFTRGEAIHIKYAEHLKNHNNTVDEAFFNAIKAYTAP